ncbi:MAG: Rrf2 family transcriptional regulator [Chloroflexi bacterium]|nr:Rrf2 family transcriptional regulator [Chloroflexota bacterium]
MFRISRRVDYAVRMMVELGLQPSNSFMSARQMSIQTAVSKPFLHKITADLVRADLIFTQFGPKGGVALKKATDEINLLTIAEAIEGSVCLNICLIRPQECERDMLCPAHAFWGDLQTMIVAELRQTTLSMLVTEAQLLQKQPRKRLLNFPYVEDQDGASEKLSIELEQR